MRTFVLALVGLALPVGLALAVYLSSAGTIAAAPASLPPSAVTIAQPSAAVKEAAKKKQPKNASTCSKRSLIAW